MAIAALIFDDDRYIVRFPMVCFSTMTIWLMYLTGKRLFGTAAGLLASALCTFSPICIGMSSFGRYFAMVQFLTLLALYFFWQALRGGGPVNRRSLWLAAVSFIAMFYTWEGAALIAPGMMLAAVALRRRRLRSLLANRSVWAAVIVVSLAILLQYCHSQLVKTQFLWYGTSLSDLTLKPMWRYPGAQPWYYVLESSWTQDAILPLLGLFGAGLLALRHPFRHGARFLLIVHLVTCLLMALTLPGLAWRYIHHLVPLPILFASAAAIALSRGICRLTRACPVPAYGRVVAAVLVAVLFALGSGVTLQLPEMRSLRIEGYGTRVLKFPDFEGCAKFLNDHLEDGDLVLATDPFHINHLIALSGREGWRTDFWLATALRFPGTIDDRRCLPLDRRDGTRMVVSLESLEDLFARHRRVWALVQSERHEVLNDRDVSIYLRQHMQVAHEDWESLVLFRGEHNRPASLRYQDEKSLRDSQSSFFP
jgi:hypothetical protein